MNSLGDLSSHNSRSEYMSPFALLRSGLTAVDADPVAVGVPTIADTVHSVTANRNALRLYAVRTGGTNETLTVEIYVQLTGSLSTTWAKVGTQVLTTGILYTFKDLPAGNWKVGVTAYAGGSWAIHASNSGKVGHE